MENKTHEGNYAGSKNMKAENQSVAFVGDTLENAQSVTSVNLMKDDLNEGKEDKPLNLNDI